MKQENILYGIIGLLLGVIVGFFGANYLNHTAPAPSAVPTGAPNAPFAQGQQAPGGAMLPQVGAALDKAKSEPDNFDAQKQAGMMYYKIRNLDEATRYLTQANRINPEDRETLVTLGNISFDGDKYPDAEKFYTAALEQKPDDPDVRTDLGLSFFLRQPRDIDRAISEYRKALQYDPKHELTLQNLCAALKEKGDKEALAVAVKQLEAVNPQNAALPKLKQ
jgi:tetratricopeptide (TPR) repeat protein